MGTDPREFGTMRITHHHTHAPDVRPRRRDDRPHVTWTVGFWKRTFLVLARRAISDASSQIVFRGLRLTGPDLAEDRSRGR